jgi:hypothetical protein
MAQMMVDHPRSVDLSAFAVEMRNVRALLLLRHTAASDPAGASRTGRPSSPRHRWPIGGAIPERGGAVKPSL